VKSLLRVGLFLVGSWYIRVTFETFDDCEPRVDGERRPEARGAMDAVEFARKRLKFEPDDRQIEVLRSNAKRGILNCTRQWGKSTIAAAKAVHRACTQDKSLVLVAESDGPAERGAGSKGLGDGGEFGNHAARGWR
jgi:hypothetical protein